MYTRAYEGVHEGVHESVVNPDSGRRKCARIPTPERRNRECALDRWGQKVMEYCIRSVGGGEAVTLGR